MPSPPPLPPLYIFFFYSLLPSTVRLDRRCCFFEFFVSIRSCVSRFAVFSHPFCSSLLFGSIVRPFLLRVSCTLPSFIYSHPSFLVFFISQAFVTPLHSFWFHTRFSALVIQFQLAALLPHSPGVSASFATAWACSKEPPPPGVNHAVHSGNAVINKAV